MSVRVVGVGEEKMFNIKKRKAEKRKTKTKEQMRANKQKQFYLVRKDANKKHYYEWTNYRSMNQYRLK